VDCLNGLGIVLAGAQLTCWAKPKSEDQRNNRRTPKYFLKRSCLFQDEPIVMILTSVISLRLITIRIVCLRSNYTVWPACSPQPPCFRTGSRGSILNKLKSLPGREEHCRKAEPPPFRAERLQKKALSLERFENYRPSAVFLLKVLHKINKNFDCR